VKEEEEDEDEDEDEEDEKEIDKEEEEEEEEKEDDGVKSDPAGCLIVWWKRMAPAQCLYGRDGMRSHQAKTCLLGRCRCCCCRHESLAFSGLTRMKMRRQRRQPPPSRCPRRRCHMESGAPSSLRKLA